MFRPSLSNSHLFLNANRAFGDKKQCDDALLENLSSMSLTSEFLASKNKNQTSTGHNLFGPVCGEDSDTMERIKALDEHLSEQIKRNATLELDIQNKDKLISHLESELSDMKSQLIATTQQFEHKEAALKNQVINEKMLR